MQILKKSMLAAVLSSVAMHGSPCASLPERCYLHGATEFACPSTVRVETGRQQTPDLSPKTSNEPMTVEDCGSPLLAEGKVHKLKSFGAKKDKTQVEIF